MNDTSGFPSLSMSNAPKKPAESGVGRVFRVKPSLQYIAMDMCSRSFGCFSKALHFCMASKNV